MHQPSLLLSNGRNCDPDITGTSITSIVVEISFICAHLGLRNPRMAKTNSAANTMVPNTPRSPIRSSQVLCDDTSVRSSPT